MNIARRMMTCCLMAMSITVWTIAQTTEIRYLSGRGCDSTTEWEFFCSAGLRSGEWTTISVPSCWECQGFGEYTYGHKEPSSRINESGRYRMEFEVPSEWKDKEVRIVFDGVATDTEVRVNGRSAGEKHQGAYYAFDYDISRLLKFGKKNLLEVDVDKTSADSSVRRAEREVVDFWIYGGIYRPVWLEVKPKNNIRRMAIDARADGTLRADIFLNGKTDGMRVEGQVLTMSGEPLGSPFDTIVRRQATQPAMIRLEQVFRDPALWTAETPHLYKLEVRLVQDGKTLHTMTERFGFRTVEVRPSDGIYLNGRKIVFKGVNRHSHWPTSGRTLSDSINLYDAQLIKDMNMNAVRMSHYPPERYFLDVCDSLGLYVLDELTGWWDHYSTPIGRKLVREMVQRDVNHPSILFWDNGNETGFNFELDEDFEQWDPQKRRVIHPYMTDDMIGNVHYPTWKIFKDQICSSRQIVFPTEILHGLYDGGHGAGLQDFWNVVRETPNSAGFFLWDFADQGLVRTDQGGKIDTDGDHGADGILGPYREKEGSFYTIKEIWSPVQIEGKSFLPSTFDGTLTVENCYSFTNLRHCTFSASLERLDFLNGKTDKRELCIESPDIEPGLKGHIHIPLPKDFNTYDVLSIQVRDPFERELWTWTRTLTTAQSFAERVLRSDRRDCMALLRDGELEALKSGGNVLPLSNCRIASQSDKETDVEISNLKDGWVQVRYSCYKWPKSGMNDNLGVTFDFPEDKVIGMRWLGDGPYRVWKNRMKGVCFGLWQKDYNDTMTGESWVYPEFKGYHAHMYAADIETEYGILRIIFPRDDMFLHILTPRSSHNNTNGVFPNGQISVLNFISPIGTKFNRSEQLGPQGEKSEVWDFWRNDGEPTGVFYMKYIPNPT